MVLEAYRPPSPCTAYPQCWISTSCLTQFKGKIGIACEGNGLVSIAFSPTTASSLLGNASLKDKGCSYDDPPFILTSPQTRQKVALPLCENDHLDGATLLPDCWNGPKQSPVKSATVIMLLGERALSRQCQKASILCDLSFS